MKYATIIFVLSLFAVSCQKQATIDTFHAIDPKNMDTSISPGTNFYLYANGNWMKNNPIPDEYSRWGAFNVLAEENNDRLKSVIEEAAKMTNAQKFSPEQQIGDFYKSGMDSTKLNKLGIEPIKPILDKIASIKNTKDLQDVIAYLHTYEIFPVFAIYSNADEKNSQMVITQLYQGGLGLGNKDYYTLQDARSKELREKYVQFIENMFNLTNNEIDGNTASSKNIMDIESKIANMSMTLLEQRDPNKIYNKMTIEDLQKLTPNFDWKSYFTQIGLSNPGDINVGQPEFFKGFNKLLKEVPIENWKEYLKWNVINSMADYLSDDFVNQNFDFYGKTFAGKVKNLPRWKRVLETINSNIGEALGQIYVKKYFKPEAKAKILELIENMRAAFSNRMTNLDWMSEPTKAKAKEKLAAMNVKVGYPDKWRDYSKLDITPDNFVQNVLNANKYNFDYTISKIGKPVDKTEWGMTPQTVNAYYNPNRNEIVFPAAILQYPFFSTESDDAVNYGGIGAVICHEMTHGFDDQGRQYTKDGNLQDWWTPEDAQKFKEKTQVLIAQFNNYTELDSLHINGALTLGENIADLGGLTIAYDGLQRALKKHPAPAKIDGLTPDQRFCLSWAQVWRQNIRDEELRKRLHDDVHSPADARVNCAIPNLDAFYSAFGIKEGDKMYRPKDQRAKIW